MARRQATEDRHTSDRAMAVQGHDRRDLQRLGAGGAVAGALLAGGMHPPQVVAADTPDIVGSWYVIRSTLIAPTPGVSPLTRWTMIFMANGTVIAQVAPVGFTPTGMTTVASIASGVWGQLVTAGTFGFTHLHVRYDPQSGQAFGLSKWLGSITLDPGGETFAIAYRVDVLNPDTLAMESEGEPLIGKGMRIGLDPSLQQVPGQALQ